VSQIDCSCTRIRAKSPYAPMCYRKRWRVQDANATHHAQRPYSPLLCTPDASCWCCCCCCCLSSQMPRCCWSPGA